MSESPGTALFAVFWAGAAASLTSCTVIRLPVLLGYVAGSGDSKKRSLILTSLFTLGLIVSTVLIGVTVALAGGLTHGLLHINKFIFWGLGVVLLLAGANVLGLLSPRLVPQKWRHIGDRLNRAGPVGTFLFGAFFGMLVMPACPCCGAGLIVLAGIVAAKNLALYGMALFASFALGQGLPVFAVGVLTGLMKPDLIKRLRNHMCSIEQRIQLLAGNLLIVLGLYFIVVG